MKVLIVGSGGREHALAWRLAQDSSCEKIFLAPGNPGAGLDQNIEIVPIPANAYNELVEFAQKQSIGLVVVGPDQALADGLVDKLQKQGIAAFGPTAAAAQIEASKAFAKKLMEENSIPTARFSIFTNAALAKQYLENCGWKSGWALKADGLALGKGVVVTDNLSEAQHTIDDFLGGSLGEAGKKIIIEEKLVGREVSAFYLCDGKTYRKLAYACDYKQIGDGGTGPNTGGMGAYSPVAWVSSELQIEVEKNVVEPLLAGMQSKDTPFFGMLFIGLMVTAEGPRVLEFNARFGDPETQAFLPLIKGDFTKVLYACARAKLQEVPTMEIQLSEMRAVHIVAAAQGYPGFAGEKIRKGDLIEWHQEQNNFQQNGSQVKIFFAGVQKNEQGKLITSGGRVFGITALALTQAEARAKAYAMFQHIGFSGMQKRNDIGL